MLYVTLAVDKFFKAIPNISYYSKESAEEVKSNKGNWWTVRKRYLVTLNCLKLFLNSCAEWKESVLFMGPSTRNSSICIFWNIVRARSWKIIFRTLYRLACVEHSCAFNVSWTNNRKKYIVLISKLSCFHPKT